MPNTHHSPKRKLASPKRKLASPKRKLASPKSAKSAKGFFSSSMNLVKNLNPELHGHLTKITQHVREIDTKDPKDTFSRMTKILGHVSNVHQMLTTTKQPQMNPHVEDMATHATTAIQETMKPAPSQPLLKDNVDHIRRSATALSQELSA
jgi:hypothetical protein